MSIPATCTKCGHRFITSAISIENSVGVTFSNCIVSCERCGGEAKIQDGTYDFVGKAMAAFRAPGVTRANVTRFQDLAKGVQTGSLSKEYATIEIESLGTTLATFWKLANDNSGGLNLLISVIALYLAISSNFSADDATQKHLRSTQAQAQEIQYSNQIQQKILTELQKQTEAATMHEGWQSTIESSKIQSRQQTPSKDPLMNRHQGRKAAAQKSHQFQGEQ